MKLHGRAHRLWLWCLEHGLTYSTMWIWRPFCWLGSGHHRSWNAGRYYCLICQADL